MTKRKIGRGYSKSRRVRWTQDLLRFGGQAAAIASILALVAYCFPIVRDVFNSDPPRWIGEKSFNPIAKAVQDIQEAQSTFVRRLNDFDIGQMQRECLSLVDRKEGLELRRTMSGDDRLVRETLAQVARTMERLQKQIEAAGQIPDCR